MRYAVKGSNTADVTGCSGAALVGLMGRNITPGRVFWLTSVWYPPHGTTGKVILFDATIGTMATGALAMTASAGATGEMPVIFMLSATQGVYNEATAGSVLTGKLYDHSGLAGIWSSKLRV